MDYIAPTERIILYVLCIRNIRHLDIGKRS